jgi:hypothetical protein
LARIPWSAATGGAAFACSNNEHVK